VVENRLKQNHGKIFDIISFFQLVFMEIRYEGFK
jgi:hypothetical protein